MAFHQYDQLILHLLSNPCIYMNFSTLVHSPKLKLTCPVSGTARREHPVPWPLDSDRSRICPHKCPGPVCRRPRRWRTSPTERGVLPTGDVTGLRWDGLGPEQSPVSPMLSVELEQPGKRKQIHVNYPPHKKKNILRY